MFAMCVRANNIVFHTFFLFLITECYTNTQITRNQVTYYMFLDPDHYHYISNIVYAIEQSLSGCSSKPIFLLVF